MSIFPVTLTNNTMVLKVENSGEGLDGLSQGREIGTIMLSQKFEFVKSEFFSGHNDNTTQLWSALES